MDTEEWVVLELNPRSEGEDPAVIRKSIQHSVKGAEVFLPAIVTQVGDDKVVHYLVEGYAFVRRTLPDAAYLRLENTRFVQGVLTVSGSGKSRKLATVPSSAIENFRLQIRSETDQGIAVGDRVLITTGAYRNIEASVIEDIPEQQMVQVFVRLRSKQSIVTIPRSGLKVLERSPISGLYNRLSFLRTWIRLASPILLWSDARADGLVVRMAQVDQLSKWVTGYSHLFSFIHPNSIGPNLSEAQGMLQTLSRLSIWRDQAHRLYTFVSAYYHSPEEKFVGVRKKVEDVLWLDGVLSRIRLLHQEVEAISQTAAREGDNEVVQNLLVDGHNLAFRCLYAPGMSELKDSKGRPTGMILGFLRSLGALRKRFPEARIYVAWDGSSKRRKAKFSDYKSNRSRADADGPLSFLREILPLLGVVQTYNLEEEADDVIATLVRGPLKDEKNLIFSTDRDFLQLVTPTTEVLLPGVGNRHEARYSVGLLAETYGVSPEKMVQLRAFFGDDSDTIPGVPRVPKKILKALLQAHGSVDGVYNSGLVGLTKSQYERLRSSEPQVRINLDLMTLLNVQFTTIEADVDPGAVAAKLQEMEINPESVLTSFFGHRAGSVDS